MTRDDLFTRDEFGPGEFRFDASVAAVFDDMLVRSVPFYREQQAMFHELAVELWQPGTVVYDLGCSTGTTLINLGKALGDDARLVGYDNSQSMLEQARRNVREAALGDRVEIRYGDLAGPVSDLSLEGAGLVTFAWTLQFVRPELRDALIRSIHQNLVSGGALILTEKILAEDSALDETYVNLYYDFKRRNGYTETEILRKKQALENVLVPYPIRENLALFRRSGFSVVDTFFQWYNFAGFLCVKSAP